MNKKGSIIIFTLIAFTICILIGYRIVELTYTQFLIQSSYTDKIQCDSFAESKIYKLLGEDYYFGKLIKPKIHEYIGYIKVNGELSIAGKSYFTVKFEDNIVEDDTYKKFDINFFNEENRLLMEVSTDVNYKGFNSHISVKSGVFNQIFELNKNSVVSRGIDPKVDTLLDEFLKNLSESISKIKVPTNMKKIDTFDYDNISLKNSNNLVKVVKTTNNTESFETFDSKSSVLLIIKNKFDTPTTLTIEDDITLNGILYIEGDLIINSNFNFNGIIIQKGVNNNIIVDNKIKSCNIQKPKINGIILTEGDTEFKEFIDIEHKSYYINKYGIYLPGFIKTDILSIKRA